MIEKLSVQFPIKECCLALSVSRAFWRSVPGPVRYSPLTQPARYFIQTDSDIESLALLEGSLPFISSSGLQEKRSTRS